MDLQIFYSWWDIVIVTAIPEAGYVHVFLIRPTNNKTFISVRLVGKQYMYQKYYAHYIKQGIPNFEDISILKMSSNLLTVTLAC